MIANVTRVFYGYSFAAQIEHLTLNQCAQLAEDYAGGQYGTTSSLNLVNSLLVDVSADGNAYVTTDHTPSVSGSGMFQTVGAGSHYLEHFTIDTP